ncbi:CIC11C00000003437 [Sungouiella intermedia]|uniref:CIC11C00000003437 n=1 Tax=Sungouiella intermedia TaxID=45354 RepID=A0A1L0BZX8_9ASCO|nr:CIC11C00000003437 [[Candida] intermedia]
MSSLDESDVGSEYSDDDIAPEAFMDIDPELSTMPATNDMDDMDSLSDDIITFTDDEDDEDYVLENEYGNGDDLSDNLRLASGFKLKKQPKSQHYGKRRAMRDAMKAMDPEALDYLSKANTAYVNHKLDEAAFYCQQAIINLKGDSRELAAARDECIQERSMLYKEKGQYGRALEGLQKLHLKNPKNETYVKNLASVYVEQKRINDAVNLYMRILDSNMKQNGPPPFDPVFGWSELNILCELFLTQHSWRMGVKIIKTVARWINNRTDEVWWDDQDDDCEFDSRRAQMIHKKRPSDYNQFLGRDFELPIDLRFKLGCFRLELDQKEEALSHFRSLFAHTDRYDVVDLFFDAGRNLEKHGYYKEALEFLEELSRLEESSEASVLKARCYMELFEYDHAKRVLLEVISKNPDDLDLKLMLAEAFLHTEDTENARKLIIEVEEKKALLGVQDEEELEDDVSEEPSLAIIRNSATLKMEAKPTDEERNKAEDHATRLVKNKFGRMQRILQSLDKSGKVGAATWLNWLTNS